MVLCITSYPKPVIAICDLEGNTHMAEIDGTRGKIYIPKTRAFFPETITVPKLSYRKNLK